MKGKAVSWHYCVTGQCQQGQEEEEEEEEEQVSLSERAAVK